MDELEVSPVQSVGNKSTPSTDVLPATTKDLVKKCAVEFPKKVNVMRLPSVAGTVAVNIGMGLAALAITGLAKVFKVDSSNKYFRGAEKALMLLAGVVASTVAAWDTVWSGNWNERQFRESYNRAMAFNFAAFTALTISKDSTRIEPTPPESNRVLVQIFDLLTKHKRSPPSTEIFKVISFFILSKPDFEVKMDRGEVIKYNLKPADLELTSPSGKIMAVGGKLNRAIQLKEKQLVKIKDSFYEVMKVTSGNAQGEEGAFSFKNGTLKINAGGNNYTVTLKQLSRPEVADRQSTPLGNLLEFKQRIPQLSDLGDVGLKELKDGNFLEAQKKAQMQPEDPLALIILAITTNDAAPCQKAIALAKGNTNSLFITPADGTNLLKLLRMDRSNEIKDLFRQLGSVTQLQDTYIPEYASLHNLSPQECIKSCDAHIKSLEQEATKLKRRIENLPKEIEEAAKMEDSGEVVAALTQQINEARKNLQKNSKEWAYLTNLKKLAESNRLQDLTPIPGLSEVLNGDALAGRKKALKELNRTDPRLHLVLALSHAAHESLTDFMMACDDGAHFSVTEKDKAFFKWLASQRDNLSEVTARFIHPQPKGRRV